MPLQPGQNLSHYRLIERIGAGGMGVVWRAQDTHLDDRDVAVKVLPAGALTSDEARSRFRKEAVALSKINHPNVAVVHDFDTDDGIDFLVMEYIPGQTLTETLSAGPLPEAEILRLGKRLAEGLEAAHSADIIHRDLKPGNLRVTADGRLKILDFGLAKLRRPATETAATETATHPGAVLGTLPYSAPEQLRGDPVDARADIYATGAVLYEMATGRRAFPETDTARLVYSIVHENPEPPSSYNTAMSRDLEAVILKALEKDPDRRYQSIESLRSELGRAAAGISVAAPTRLGRRVRRWALWAAVPLVLAFALIVGLNVGGLRDSILGSEKQRRYTSLAVLPLEDLSRDPGNEYLADGMTEALITDLGKIRALRVIAPPSVKRFKGSKLPLPEIARQLGVDAVVVGSVLPVGGRMRITAQLVDAREDTQLWADRFERDMSDVLIVQSEIAGSIASQVQATLTPEEGSLLARARPIDPAAHEAYLRGRYHLARFTGEEAEKALTLFRRAIEIDSGYAPAHAMLGRTYFHLRQPFLRLPIDVAIPNARAAVQQALELDELLEEAYAYRALIRHYFDYDWTGAESDYRRAIELSPSFAEGYSLYAFLLSSLNRHDEAIAASRRALELDPVSLTARVQLAEQTFYARRYDEALEECGRDIDLDPDFQRPYRIMTLIFETRSMYPEAIDAFVKYYGKESSWRSETELSLLRAWEEDGRDGYWRWMLSFYTERYGETASTLLASIHAQLGDRQEAFACLERGYERREGDMVLITVDPTLDPLRSDQRFEALLHRMGLY